MTREPATRRRAGHRPEEPGPGSGDPLTILVADDDVTNRTILRSILAKDGFRVRLAANGREAVECFAEHAPDLVLMDVMMPGMDGYEATRRIKQTAGDRFVPVLFLTGVTDEQALTQCISCGGDGFLTKPYSRTLLRAHLAAHIRLRALYAEIKAQKDELTYHQRRQRLEHEIASEVIAKAINAESLDIDSIRYLLCPSETFNGDLLLAAQSPSGGLNVFLGDFTGHGLPAAVGAIPTSQIFYTMTAKGCSVREIVCEINRKMRQMLPTGFFCAASVAEIDPAHDMLTIWNGGNPDVLVRDRRGRIRERFPPGSLPLGVVDNEELDTRLSVVALEKGDRIYVASDGVLDAPDPKGRFFGAERYERCLDPSVPVDGTFDRLLDAIAEFRDGAPQHDDITLIEVAYRGRDVEAVPETEESPCRAGRGTTWCSVLELHPDSLRRVNPIPILLQQLIEIQGLHTYKPTLYTILTELFTNALDHGLLGLSSAVKDSAGGFTEYFERRERALAELTRGSIRIELHHEPRAGGGRLTIRVTDSGSGFDPGAVRVDLDHHDGLSGRGLAMVRSLCTEFQTEPPGNRAVAVLDWD